MLLGSILSRRVTQPRLEHWAEPVSFRHWFEPDPPFEIPIWAHPLMMQLNFFGQYKRL
jgi:hypothetical protein